MSGGGGPVRGEGFYRALVRRPVFLWTLFTTILVVGLVAYERIPLQMMPDGFSSPGLQVFAANPGASATENEEQVTRVLEEELRSLPGIEDIESTSRQDSVGLFLMLRADSDMAFAKAEVRDRIERARPKLPKTVRDIGIWSWSQSSMPIAFMAILHPGDSQRTDFLIDEVVQRKLESIDGVGKVEIWGTLDDSLRILLDEDRVRAANLDLGGLIGRLSRDNFALPMGEVEDGGRRVLLRSDMRFTDPAEIERYPIGNGLTIADVGRVEHVKTVRQQLTRIDGSYAYFGEIQKDGSANTVETCRRLNTAIAELERDPRLAGEFKIVKMFDQGEFIENSLSALRETAVEGGILAIAILFLFLWRVRLTLLVALSIPFSALVAISWGFFTGGSFNVLTMTGITLAMGMLVDNSIVVVENVTRLRQLGHSTYDACVLGTGEVGLAVLLSTLTSVVVFLPLIFMSENPQLRLMFGELGLPLCISLLASLGAALVFLPVQVLPALHARPRWVQTIADRIAPIADVPSKAFAVVFAVLGRVAHASMSVLAHLERALTVVIAPLRHVLTLAFVALGAWRAFSLWPAIEIERRFGELGAAQPGISATVEFASTIAVALAGAATSAFGLRWMRSAVAPLRSHTRTPAEGDTSIVGRLVALNRVVVGWTQQHRLASCGIAFAALLTILFPAFNMQMASFGQDSDPGRLNFWVELEDNFTLAQAETEIVRYEDALRAHQTEWKFDRVLTRFNSTGGRLSLFWESPPGRERMDEVRVALKGVLPNLAGHKLVFLDDEGGDRMDRSVVTFRLVGPDSEELDRIGARAVAALEDVDGLSSLRSPLQSAPPQVRVRLDSDVASSLGITANDALQNIAWALRGTQLPQYQEQGREVPLLIEYDESEAAGLSTLRDLEVFTRESAVPLSSFADLEFGRGARAIQRTNGQASFTIQARVDSPARQMELAAAGRRALDGLDLPRGYRVADDDQADVRQAEEMQSIFAALALSVVLVFLLMGVLFESFSVPIAVLFTIPFAIVGSYWALYLTGTAMDSVGWIGIIILVGVVANHGVVLIDRIHQLRKAGTPRAIAVIEGCANRVRPVLMTSIIGVIALLPMARTEPRGEGIDYRALATCVAGGLTISTIFTLWVVPLAYTLIDDGWSALTRHVRDALTPRARREAALEGR